MDTAPGTKGIIIGDRYRVAGVLRRGGLIDAVDLEADRNQAACRVVSVPGDAEHVDAWEDAWRAAQSEARLPRLREIVADDDGAHWAVLDASIAVSGRLPADAREQAHRMGMALVEAGLDADEVTPGMLACDADGQLVLDGSLRLGGSRSPSSAGRLLADLLPAPALDDSAAVATEWAPRRRAPRASRRRRSRLLVPLAIIALLVAAGAVLVVPDRSTGTASLAPAAPADALLGGIDQPLAIETPVAAPPVARPRKPAPRTEAGAPPVVTVTVAESPSAAKSDDPTVPEIPAAAASPVPDLPVAVPPAVVLPLARGG